MTNNAIRIASYNIRKARGLDQRRMPNRILSVINTLSADVVVLQEADRRLGVREPALPRMMIESETDFQLVELSENGISLGWHGNAVLARKGFAVSHVERLKLPGLEPRGAVRFDLDIGAGVSVIAAHLGLMRRDRRAQLNALCDATTSCAHTVIAGDFNEWSQHKGLEPLEHGFDVHAPGRTFHARRPMAALDRFALSEGIQLRDAGVEQGALAKVSSDHLPIWADIDVPMAAPTC